MENYRRNYETLNGETNEPDCNFRKIMLQIEMKKKIPQNKCHHQLIIIAGQYYEINAKAETLICYCLSCDQRFVIEFAEKRYFQDDENGLLSLMNFSFLTESYIGLLPNTYALNQLINRTYFVSIKPLIQMVLEENEIYDYEELRRKISSIIGRRGKVYEPNFSSTNVDDKNYIICDKKR